MDLVAAQRVERGQRRRVERGDHELAVGLEVAQAHPDEALVRGTQQVVVQGLLEREALHDLELVAVGPEVHGETEPIAGRRVRQLQPADVFGEAGGLDLLQAEHIGGVSLIERGELIRRRGACGGCS